MAASSTAPDLIDVRGAFLLGLADSDPSGSTDWVQNSATECAGAGAYSTVADSDVVVTNENGTTLAATKLEPGAVTSDGCVFTWDAGQIRYAPFYRVQIGTWNVVTFTGAQALQGPLVSGPTGS